MTLQLCRLATRTGAMELALSMQEIFPLRKGLRSAGRLSVRSIRHDLPIDP